MTFEEIKNLQISHVISNVNEFKALVKQCLSIIETVTVKDDGTIENTTTIKDKDYYILFHIDTCDFLYYYNY